MLQVAQALDHGHKNGIVHRELRPEAIMVDAEDQTKLADLGITKVGSTKFLMGTNAQYVAPEQVRGVEVDIRTDIYSFGCTFFDALVGKPPFRGNTPKEILSCQISEEAPDVAELAEGVPEELADVIATCMEKSPDDRYQLPVELIEDLQKVSFKQQAKGVRKPGGKTPSGRFISRRHRAGRRHRRR
jgi:serine/threonine-protein kinase